VLHCIQLSKSVCHYIIKNKMTHFITVWDCGDNHNHIYDYAGQEIDLDCQNVELVIYK
jgi:hypothetical protein